MSIFNKKKVYCVEWHSKWSVYRKEFIKAKDEADAWQKIKKQNPGVADFCDDVYEITLKKPEINY